MKTPFTPPALPDFTQRTSFSFKELAHSSSDAIITSSMGPGPYHNIRQGAIYRIEAVMQDFRERIVYSMRDETPVFDDRETWSDLHEEIYRECFEPPRESLETNPYLAVRLVGEEMRVTCGFIIDLSDEHHCRFLHFRGHRGIVWYLDLVSDSFAECEVLWEMIQKRYYVMSEFPEPSTGEQKK